MSFLSTSLSIRRHSFPVSSSSTTTSPTPVLIAGTSATSSRRHVVFHCGLVAKIIPQNSFHQTSAQVLIMKSSLPVSSFTLTDVVIVLSSIFLLPIFTHLTDHKITCEECSYLFTLTVFSILSRFHYLKSSLIISLISGGLFYVFVPVFVEYCPPSLMPLTRFPYGSNLYPNLESKQFVDIKVYENLTMKEVYEVVATLNEPILFRNVVPGSEKIARKIVDRLASSDKKYLSQRFQTRPYDFFRGSRFEAGLRSNISEVLESKHNEYIGFEPLLTPEEDAVLFGTADNSNIVDHSFLSNFNETLVTTFVHGAAATTSWSFQLAGKKTWFFWSPEFDPTFNTGWFCRVMLPSHGDEYALFSLPTIRVNVNEGDILVFTPRWYHTVVTHSGFNMMITFRTKYGNWLSGVIPSIRFFTATALFKFFGRNTPHYLPGIRKIRMDTMQSVYDESPEGLRWENPDRYTQ
jgi:hypothetical protein